MTDLVVAPHRAPSSVVPPNEWLLMTNQAEYLAQSDIVPRDYRRKPANIVVAALSGRTHGWDVITSMRNGHVIEGTWGLRPEAQLGLVRRAGHSVTGTMTAEGATVLGKRADDGTEMSITFTVEDARRAGLANKQTWKNYPQMMCWWRAIGILCRVHFSDVTLGLMSVEELGADIDENGEVIDIGPIDHGPAEPVALGAEAMSKFVEACEQHGLDPSAVMARAFPDHQLDDPVLDTELPRLRDVFRAMVEEEVLLAEHEGTVPDPEPDLEEFRRDEIEGGTEGAGDEVRPASRGQVGLIKAVYERMGYDRYEQLRTSSAVIGRDILTHNQLNVDEAGKVIDYQDSLEPSEE